MSNLIYIVLALPAIAGSLAMVGAVVKLLSLILGYQFTYKLAAIAWVGLILIVVIVIKCKKLRKEGKT